jgi:hypothetical protein
MRTAVKPKRPHKGNVEHARLVAELTQAVSDWIAATPELDGKRWPTTRDR